MPWYTTEDAEEYLAATDGFLATDLAANTVLATVGRSLRDGGSRLFGRDAALLGWWRPDATAGGTATDTDASAHVDACVDTAVDRGPAHGVAAAFVHTPPRELLLSAALPPAAVPRLAELFIGAQRPLTGVNADAPDAAAFAEAWRLRTGAGSEVHMRERLYRLTTLVPPVPGPPGRARAAASGDADLLAEWAVLFESEAHGLARIPDADAMQRLRSRARGGSSDRDVLLWEVDGRTVAMAGHTRPVGGMVRIGPVFTPAEQRRRGYAAAVTAAACRAALDAGAEQVVLYADLANRTSTGVYLRLGFTPVRDRLALSFV